MYKNNFKSSFPKHEILNEYLKNKKIKISRIADAVIKNNKEHALPFVVTEAKKGNL
jgi:hypothetical protein